MGSALRSPTSTALARRSLFADPTTLFSGGAGSGYGEVAAHPPPDPPEEEEARSLLRRALVRFNAGGGLGLLFEHSLLTLPDGTTPDPAAIALFLRCGGALPNGLRIVGEPLSRQRVGEYLGSLGGDEASRRLHADVLLQYMKEFNFRATPLVPALRDWLSGFRLPGEAQQIDRLMARFGDTYYRHNPSAFASSDVVYLLSFAVIMLNTDLHRGTVKHKMTMAQFVNNLAPALSLGGGGGVPLPVLAAVYDDVAAAPLALDLDDVAVFLAPQRVGWLDKKCSGSLGRFKRRYFLLGADVEGCVFRGEGAARALPCPPPHSPPCPPPPPPPQWMLPVLLPLPGRDRGRHPALRPAPGRRPCDYRGQQPHPHRAQRGGGDGQSKVRQAVERWDAANGQADRI